MQVSLAQSAGFCWGVKRAVRKALELARAQAMPVHTLGPLIHNKEMMEQLRAEGVRECADAQDLEGGVLMIRAHGIAPDRRTRLEELPLKIVDATCPMVARIQAKIRQHAATGHFIVIFGDPGHAEVVGLEGYAQGRSSVVTRPQDVEGLPAAMAPVCLVSQTTQFPAAYREVAEAVRRRFPDAVVLDTICASTKRRQQELVEMADSVDALVVVGGSHSANTVRLVQLARSLRPTIHIQTAEQIDARDFRGVRKVGLTAGASTPDFVIASVKQALEAM